MIWYSYYRLVSGRLDGEKQSFMPPSKFECGATHGYVLGLIDPDLYYVDLSATETVQQNSRDPLNNMPLVDPVTLEYLTEDYVQHVPTLKTPGPWNDNYSYTLGGNDLVIQVPNPTTVTVEFNGQPVQSAQITDGTLEFSATLAGDYTIILDAVIHLKKTITVTVA